MFCFVSDALPPNYQNRSSFVPSQAQQGYSHNGRQDNNRGNKRYSTQRQRTMQEQTQHYPRQSGPPPRMQRDNQGARGGNRGGISRQQQQGFFQPQGTNH